MSLQEMFDALVARGPNSLLAEHAGALASLIGSWTVEVFDAEGDGAKRVSDGEWHFGWVLEGRAIQDVLIVPERQHRTADLPAKGNRYATSLRMFDPAAAIWRVISVDPVGNICLSMTSREADREIISEGEILAGNRVRFTLFDLTHDAFRAREERLSDGEWQVTTELRAHRKKWPGAGQTQS